MVLRKLPLGAPSVRDVGIRREWRILATLGGNDVPHAKAHALCDDTDVLGRPFYVMDFVDGWSPMGEQDGLAEPFRSHPDLRADLAHQLVDGVAPGQLQLLLSLG